MPLISQSKTKNGGLGAESQEINHWYTHSDKSNWGVQFFKKYNGQYNIYMFLSNLVE